MESQILVRVVTVLGKVTGKKVTDFNLQGELRNELCLDSIQIVEFFSALEEEFQIELPLEMMAVKTGSEFVDKLESALRNFNQLRNSA